MFTSVFPYLAEVSQEDDAHRLLRDEMWSYGRLDRLYCSLPTQDILDLCPSTGVVWPASDLAKPSDRVPVFLKLVPWGPQGPSPIPVWVANHR
eukprot:7503403-Pyramimonas_sp.AAC.1